MIKKQTHMHFSYFETVSPLAAKIKGSILFIRYNIVVATIVCQTLHDALRSIIEQIKATIPK
jgi:hypothetical protein